MDVVALHQSGVTKVVATLGTATTTEHLKTLARTTNTIVFCFGPLVSSHGQTKTLTTSLLY
jgi:DNA primase